MPIEQNELEKILESLGVGFRERNDKLTEEVSELKQKIDELMKKGVDLGASVPVSGKSPSSQQPQQSTSPSDSKNSDPEEIAWNSFFTTGKSITDPAQQEAWKVTSGLTPDEAQQVWDNGWRDLINGITDLGNGKANYSSKGETAAVDLLEHEKKSLDAIHRLLFDVKGAGLSSALPNNGDIKRVVDKKKVPNDKDYEALRLIKENRAKELFKKGFESNDKNHGLSDDEIDAWRKEVDKTGLGGDGTNEREAFNNGWTDPTKISNGKLKEDNNIDVLKHDKNELDQADAIIAEIASKNTFKELNDWKEKKDPDIKNLKDDKLPEGKRQKDINNKIAAQKATFFYVLNVPNNEVDGDGLTPENLTDALTFEKEKRQPKKYGKLTANILNQFLNAGEPIKVVEEVGASGKDPKYKTIPWQLVEGEKEDDLDGWLTSQENKGFKIDEEPERELKIGGKPMTIKGEKVVALEEELSLAKKGTFLLPFFYDKMKFDIDKIKNEDGKYNMNNFCSWKEETTSKGNKVKKVGVKQGELAIGTGVGKTTKTVCCLCRGGEQNVILVCPTEALVNSAYNHHKGWLQKWGCVYHAIEAENEDGSPVMVEKRDEKGKVIMGEDGKPIMETAYESHGSYEYAKNDLCYWIDETKTTEDKHDGKKGVSIMEKGYLLGFLARELYKTSSKKADEKPLQQNKKEELKKLYPDFDERVAAIKTRLIPKDETIIIFDEAHYASPIYQELIKQTIFLGYKVIKMSATFKGKPFSITSSYKIENTLVNGFNSSDDETLYKNGKTLMFLNNTKLTQKQKEILENPENNVPYVIFDGSNSAAAEGISFGMPKGCLLIVDPEYEMGFTFDADTAIITDWIDLKSLGKFWIYGNSETQRVPIASWGQERGRVGRIRKGFVKALSNATQEIDSKTDLAQVMVRAILSGSTKELEKFYSNLNNVNYLRGALSLSGEKYKFGKNPEEILIGLKGQPTPLYPTFNNKPDGNPDKELWERHQGIYKPEPMSEDRAREILALMIDTYINNQTNFPQELKIDFESTLIKETNFSIDDVRAVLNGVIEEKLKSLPDYKEGETKYKNESTFKQIVALHKLSLGVDIKIKDAKDKTKKVLKVNYPKISEEEKATKKSMGRQISEEEKNAAWRCNRCLKVNSYSKYCENCGIKKKTVEAKEINVAQILHDTNR